jgi:hypothetical protein
MDRPPLLARLGLIVVVAALAAAPAAAADTQSPAAYRATLNTYCRGNTPFFHSLEAGIDVASKNGRQKVFYADLGRYFTLLLEENRRLESTPVPEAVRVPMGAAQTLLRRADSHVRTALAAVKHRDAAALSAASAKLGPLSGLINAHLDAAGLRDCGSNQQ